LLPKKSEFALQGNKMDFSAPVRDTVPSGEGIAHPFKREKMTESV